MPSVPAEVLSSGEPDQTSLLGTATPAQPRRDLDGEAAAVLAHWKPLHKPGASIEGKAAKDRHRRIVARLREGWTVDRLKRVSDGALNDPFLMGTDPKSRAEGYRDVDTIYRDNAQCERLEALAGGPPIGRVGRVVHAAAPIDLPNRTEASDAARAAHRPSFVRGST